MLKIKTVIHIGTHCYFIIRNTQTYTTPLKFYLGNVINGCRYEEAEENRVVRDRKASWRSITGLTVENTGSLIASS
jgi:hypothetical protein